MRALGALVMLGSCAVHPPPRGGLARPAPAAVSLAVRADGEALQALVAATEAHARERLQAQQHEVVEEAPLSLEVEIAEVGGVVRNGAYQYCVRLIGRLGQGASSTQTVKERCEVVRLSNDPASVIAAAAVTLGFETASPSAGSALYLATLDELTDALARLAVRSD